MSDKRRESAKAFAQRWKDRGYEKGETQKFWLDLLQNVLGVEDPYSFVNFESQVKLSNTGFIDAYIPSTRVMVEQKSIDKELKGAIRQSDGSFLTPFQQAKKYITEMPVDMHPRWVITCNFRSFLIYNMNTPKGEPFEIQLENLENEIHLLHFIVDNGFKADLKHEYEVSAAAGEIIGNIYDCFLEQYEGKETKEDLHTLNVLCVRLVFLLYAEDSGLFAKNQFFDYLKDFPFHKMRAALRDLFQTLDTPVDKRDRFLEPELKAFPYVNGSLFKEEIEIPPFTEKTAEILLKHASEDFDWSEISPTIFGAMFESTLNPETRRKGGMHYTSIENIHKVIDPLFLNNLYDEFDKINRMPLGKSRLNALRAFQDKLSSLTFFDPACGSGNFLTETYISIRRLENKVIKELFGGVMIAAFNPIKVSINQLYGIEINDFATSVATTALWIAEAQMMHETERLMNINLDFLPLKSNTNIVCVNALRVDWRSVCLQLRHSELSEKSHTFIFGNPPFVGYAYQSKQQKSDLESLMKGFGKNIDYVAGWYYKAAQLMHGTNIKAALVSTNSITQGEQVAAIWKPLFEQFGIHFDFAYRTFRWDSEANQKAHVHCVIIGFSCTKNDKPKTIYLNNTQSIEAKNINGYLLDAPSIFIENRRTPLCNIPEMQKGSIPVDGGNLIIEADEYDEFLKNEPQAAQFIKPLVGSEEFINNKKRWCLWLVHSSPSELKKCPTVMDRVQKVKEMRMASSKEATRKFADYPTRFMELRQPEVGTYVLVPSHSSESRRYIPIGFIDCDTISTNANFIIPNTCIFHFGILTSSIHMDWMRAVCGRLKSDYRYSNTIVYNNFPWPEVTEEQKAKIEQTAQAILDARAIYPDSSLADLYNETTMPIELRKAHQANDKAVMAAYGFKDMDESQIVSALMKLYQEITNRINK